MKLHTAVTSILLGALPGAALTAAPTSSVAPTRATRAPSSAEDLDAAEALVAAVDLPTTEARAKAAAALAKRKDVSLDDWLALMSAFAPLPGEQPAGTRSVTAELNILGKGTPGELWLHVPEPSDYGPRPLLVALHGAGGNGQHMLGLWRATAEATGAVLLCPTDPGPNAGYSGRPEERRAVLAAVRWARRRFDIDENRVWLTGYSRGGHLAYDLALRFPGVFAAVSPQAGSPRYDPTRGGNNLRFTGNLAMTPLRAVIGEREQDIMRLSVEQLEKRARKLDVPDFEVAVVPGKGHQLDPHASFTDGTESWASWFSARVRDPWPEEVVRYVSRDDEADAAWLTARGLSKKVLDTVPIVLRQTSRKPLSQGAIRAQIKKKVEAATGHVTARRLDSGAIKLDASLVDKARLLLRADWVPESGKVAIRRRAKTKKFKVDPDAEVLLRVFVERFDRTFLPVAELEVKTR